MITLKELAEKLNVSISTVSKALNGSNEIGEATIARVKEAAKSYNYKPNRVALSLKNSKTKTIGVIIPDILNHFFAKVLFGIDKESAKLGYNIITCLSNELYEKEAKSLELLANGSVDGFIMSVAEQTQKENRSDHFKAVIDHKTPILMFDRVADNIDCDKVVMNDFQAAFDSTMHLIKESRKHIILINSIDALSVGKQRASGCFKAIEAAKNYNCNLTEVKISKLSDLETQIDSIFNTNTNVDGIISIDNISGAVALNAAIKRNYNIPKDLSIIGFSDDNVLPFTSPKLSTVSQHSDAIGEASVQILVERIESKEPTKPITKTIDFTLNLRGTTL